MRYLILVQMLALCGAAFGDNQPPLCELATTSIVSRSAAGVAQVSNLGDIEIECRVAARPFPTRPGESRNGLTAATEAYLISDDDTKTLVASEVLVHGGGGGGFKAETAQSEFVDFSVHIPLEPEERDSEARRYLAKMEKELPQLQLSEEDRGKAIERIGESVYQQRLGHFRLSCHVLDGDRTIGVGLVEIEVLFKGRFSDVGLPGAPPT